MKSLRRMLAVCNKEFRQLSRDRLTFGMVIMIPLVQMLLFGYTINTDVRNVPVVFVDHAQSAFSRQLLTDLAATQVVNIQGRLQTVEEMMAAIQQGDYSAGIYIPSDAERRYYADEGEAIAQLIVDGSDTVLAAALKSLASMPFAPNQVLSPPDLNPLIAVQLLFNPEQRAALFTVPGLLGLILTMTMTMFTSIAVVRERERGNMELLIATPVKTPELMTGKLIPYVLIGLVQMALILLLGNLLFDIPLVGSLFILTVACLVFICANLSLGLLISTVAPNQLAAMQLFVFYFLPSILLSGFMFPFVAMPKVAQYLAEVLPMTHFMRIVRGIVLRGATWDGMVWDLLFLMGFFMFMMAATLLRFRQKLD